MVRGSIIPAKQVQVLLEAWYTHSRSVCSLQWSRVSCELSGNTASPADLFMWTTVVVTVTTTHSREERRQKQPQILTYITE